jgi:hypothetical protein
MPSARTMLEHYRSQVADARGSGLAGIGEQVRLGATIRALLAMVDEDYDPRNGQMTDFRTTESII